MTTVTSTRQVFPTVLASPLLCEQFHKYTLGDQDEGAPRRIGFPSKDNTDYDFIPRPIEPSPPGGPVSEQEFRNRFHKSCDDQGVVASLPERKTPLNMQDGNREIFWGIYARERRSFARVLAYGFSANVPGIVVFFLWLFRWDHASDLQNAAVPIGMSLSLTMLFVALLFESREIELK
ncbi:hypothetical protein CLAFUR4_08611 [Fulvia fulva]|nr:hypothetical protein CLAFUR4_08611 [Fulvia fulva]WPV27047.1 hypothetical protein CLAFUW7_08606 [Fulvia fulva]